jgi:acetoin utilization deacetylase AcuC-like enzyme
MKRTGFLYDDRYRLHETGPYHPEVPDRLPQIYQGIESADLLSRLSRIQAKTAEMKWIETVHPPEYVQRFRKACEDGRTSFDSPDNQMCAATYDTAMLAVGGLLEAVRMVMADEIDNAFCAVRPPGHHAEPTRAMGFCYFNNIAIAARYLQQQWGLQKIGIMDFDVHHGNGTQHIFEQDPDVFYYSIHQHPSFAYPGTGREFEYGTGPGHGFTQNSPVLPGRGDSEYISLIEKNFVPKITAFQPEFILVSAGFDAHTEDDMSDIRLSTAGFSWIMEKIVSLAETLCHGRVVSVLEGGYCLHRLPELAQNHVEILMRTKNKLP